MILVRANALRPFLFSLTVISALTSKVLRIYQHVGSVNPFLLGLFSPTFFVLESLLFVGVWYLLQRTSGWKYTAGTLVSGFLACVTYVATSSQIAFYVVTGSDVDWDAAVSVGGDSEGRKLIMSGLKPFLCAVSGLSVASWLLAPGIFFVMNWWWSSCFSGSPYDSADQLPGSNANSQSKSNWKLKLSRLTFVEACTASVVLVTFVLWLFRPPVPYNHLTEALPFAFFLALLPHAHHFDHKHGQFPFPSLLAKEFWEAPREHFKGWAPGLGGILFTGGASVSPPRWASGKLPSGFIRWSPPPPPDGGNDDDESDDKSKDSKGPKKHSTPENFYNPATDPLRITNLDLDVFEPLVQAVNERDIPITHVVLVMMESARKDVFPLKSGSFLHEQIRDSYDNNDTATIEKLNAKLARMTPYAERLTGEDSGFTQEQTIDAPGIAPLHSGLGGVNVDGAVTGSSFSCKSALLDHCGVSPLPVNFMGEVEKDIYQPCFPQVLKLFNHLKDGRTSSQSETGRNLSSHLQDIHSRKWSNFFAQAATGGFAEQTKLNKIMGFDEAVYREDLTDSSSKYYHSGMEKVNYFSLSERELAPYMKEAINTALAKNERLFLSHFTSSTHHPWGLPSYFPEENYFSSDTVSSKHKDMNAYLNTVRFVDYWMGEIMKILNETGVANETLVVLVGDHGQAFSEDAPKTGTYENGHISNFRVPLVFHHPLMPRIQVQANTTAMTIVPTILDLLVNTNSLNDLDTSAALDLINEYEGQSMIRPYRASHNGRQDWHFGIINTGGTMLSVGSAAYPYRLIVPLSEDKEYVFADLEQDPYERDYMREWQLHKLFHRVRSLYGNTAANWVVDAEKVARWWVDDRKRLWNYREEDQK